MTLHTLNIPDEPDKIPRWLERRLVAPDFSEFISELNAYFPKPDVPPALRDYFLEWFPKLLEEGLEAAPPNFLSQLLQAPCALSVLQERIAMEGGPYWDDVMDRSEDLNKSFNRGIRSLEQIFSPEKPVKKRIPSNDSIKPAPSRSKKKKGKSQRGYKIWAFISTAVAVCLMIELGMMLIKAPTEPPIMKSQIAWGWGKPSGLAPDESKASDYLNKLASNAEEWSQYQPSDAVSVGVRIAEFRLGCTRLMHSSYGPLTPDDKAWLLSNCRAWAKILDAHEQALDNGTDPATVRNAVDETVRQIATTLREKARQV